MIERAAIVAEGQRWLGTPYVHQGRSQYGVDCIGFVICVRHAVEAIPSWLTETRTYARQPMHGLLLSRIAAHCTPLDQVEEGCLIVIRWPRMKEPAHVALYGGGNILHAYQKVNRVIQSGYRANWLRDTHSLWRLPGVA